MAVASQQELVERVWARDATVWTGSDEDKWLGWLDEPKRMQERIGDLLRFAEEVRVEFETFVLLGMGGSSLAPEVLKRTFGAKGIHVLDTTHPAMIRHAGDLVDFAKTMFVSASKSGSKPEATGASSWPSPTQVPRSNSKRVSAIFERSSRASRRSADGTRRCRLSASCPRR